MSGISGFNNMSFSLGDLIKVGAVLVMAGIGWNKLGNIEDVIKSNNLESKEYRVRIEKLELSVAEVKLEIEQIRYEGDKANRYKRIK